DSHVGALPSRRGPLGPVQPAAADLSQRVDPALGRGPVILRILPLTIGILAAPERGEHGLTGLRIELAIDPNQSQDRCGEAESALFAQTLGVLQSLTPIERLPPVRHRVLKL